MPVYKDEVLGRHCSIMFQVNNSLQPYSGQITKYEASLQTDSDYEEEEGEDNIDEYGNSGILHKHYVVFEDGEELWFDLAAEQNHGRLKWLRGGDHAVATGRRIKEEAPDTARSSLFAYPVAGAVTHGDHSTTNGRTTTEKKKNHSKRPATVPKTPPKRNKKKKKDANTVTPPAKPFKSSDDDPRWMQNMAQWLQETPHGDGNNLKTVSPRNTRGVIRQVRKLASGEGVSYLNKWPAHIIFYKDRPIDILKSDFDSMLQEAKAYEALYGKDAGNGWLLQHPIKKLKLYQEYIRDNDLDVPVD